MITADILRGYTDVILLKQLENGDSYGYGISKKVSELSDGCLELKEATLYTAFKRLENAGFIRSYWGDEGSGARRRYYTLTEAGRERLAEERETWNETRHILNILIGGNDE